MEVGVHASRESAAGRPPARGRPRRGSSGRPGGGRHCRSESRRRQASRAAPRPRRRQVAGPRRPRRAVGVPSSAHASGDGAIGVPAAAAEERRRHARLAEPGALTPDALARVATRRARVGRAREVRVVAERRRAPQPRGHAPARCPRRARPPPRPAAASARRSRSPPGRRALQLGERVPDGVVEGSFDVARDHCVPFGRRGRHRAVRGHQTTHTTRGAPSRRRGRRAPRLLALGIEREEILEEYVEKSDTFARTLVASGTFGFLPDVPSAYTQPLYAWFLAALYWPLERSWVVVGLAQIALAVATALVVLAIGTAARLGRGSACSRRSWRRSTRTSSGTTSTSTARSSTGSLAALVVLLALSPPRPPLAARYALATGAVAGLAILSNARLVLLPLVLAPYVAWRVLPAGAGRRDGALVVVLGAALVDRPWVVRNEVVIGCPTITTDTRALWKANNPATYDVLARGGWIDDVPDLPGVPPWPERAAGISVEAAKAVDECAQVVLLPRRGARLLARRARREGAARASRPSGCSGRPSSPSTPTSRGSRGSRASRSARSSPPS